MPGVRLYLATEGEPDFDAVLTAMRAAYEALLTVQADVLGGETHRLRWGLEDLRSGSAVADLQALPDQALQDTDVDNVVTAFTRGIRFAASHHGEPPPGLSARAALAVREVARLSGRGGLRGFKTFSLPGDGRLDEGEETTAVLIDDNQGDTDVGVSPDESVELDRYVGSLVGHIRILNLADQQDRFVWLNEEISQRRVKVHYPVSLHDELVQAIEEHGRAPRRVELSGEIRTDREGRPKEMTATDLVVIPLDEDLPSLTTLIGSMPGLTDGLSAAEYVHRRRSTIGIAL